MSDHRKAGAFFPGQNISLCCSWQSFLFMSLGLAAAPRSSTDVLAGSLSTAGSDASGLATDISKK